MKITKRVLPTLIGLVLFVVGGVILVTQAQPSNVTSGSGTLNQSSSNVTLPTPTSFDSQANAVCSQAVVQLNSWWANFNEQIKNSGNVQPANAGKVPVAPPYGPTTTVLPPSNSSSALSNGLPSSNASGSSGGSANSSSASQSNLSSALAPSPTSSTTSTTSPPSGASSYNIIPTQSNPLSVTNQLLNEYVDELDAIVGIQNDTIDSLENIPEPPADTSTLQGIWVGLTEAMVAQNQADIVLANIVASYYNYGLYSATGSLQGPFSSQLASLLSDDILEFGVAPGVGGQSSSGSLEGNLDAIATSVDSMLAGYGLNECEIAGVAFQNFQDLASQIPNIASDYVTTYNQQSSANQAISLAQILATLPTPLATNISGTINGAAISSLSTTTTTATTVPSG